MNLVCVVEMSTYPSLTQTLLPIILDRLLRATKACVDLNSPQWVSSSISNDPQTLKKLDKCLDTLRRVSVKALEKASMDRERRGTILNLLDSLIQLIGGVRNPSSLQYYLVHLFSISVLDRPLTFLPLSSRLHSCLLAQR
jgi:hypothetical protein